MLRDAGQRLHARGHERADACWACRRAELPRLDGWRSDFSSTPVATLARRLDPAVTPRLSAIAIPAGATELTLPVHVTGDDVAIMGTFVGRDGRFVMADFGRTRGRTPVVLRVPVRGKLAGARLLGLRFARVSEVESHANGSGPILRGVAILGPLTAQARAAATTLVSRYDGWTGVGGARAATPFGPNAVDYFVSEGGRRVLPPPPADRRPPAGRRRQPRARRAGQRRRPARRSSSRPGTVDAPRGRRRCATSRACSARSSSSIATRWGVTLPALQPGAGTANELWLDTPSPAAVAKALAAPPFDVLQVESRAGLRARSTPTRSRAARSCSC